MFEQIGRTRRYVSILRQADIFYDLTATQLEMIASVCSEVRPKGGEIIFEENSAGDELYVIADGEVDIEVSPAMIQPTTTDQPPNPLTIATFRRGQTFGEIALVDQGLRSASARCASKRAHLLVIPRDRLIKLCGRRPGVQDPQHRPGDPGTTAVAPADAVARFDISRACDII